jgi:hypothetical protein
MLTRTRREPVEYAPDLGLQFGERFPVLLQVTTERIVDRAAGGGPRGERRQQVRPPLPA